MKLQISLLIFITAIVFTGCSQVVFLDAENGSADLTLTSSTNINLVGMKTSTTTASDSIAGIGQGEFCSTLITNLTYVYFPAGQVTHDQRVSALKSAVVLSLNDELHKKGVASITTENIDFVLKDNNHTDEIFVRISNLEPLKGYTFGKINPTLVLRLSTNTIVIEDTNIQDSDIAPQGDFIASQGVWSIENAQFTGLNARVFVGAGEPLEYTALANEIVSKIDLQNIDIEIQSFDTGLITTENDGAKTLILSLKARDGYTLSGEKENIILQIPFQVIKNEYIDTSALLSFVPDFKDVYSIEEKSMAVTTQLKTILEGIEGIQEYTIGNVVIVDNNNATVSVEIKEKEGYEAKINPITISFTGDFGDYTLIELPGDITPLTPENSKILTDGDWELKDDGTIGVDARVIVKYGGSVTYREIQESILSKFPSVGIDSITGNFTYDEITLDNEGSKTLSLRLEAKEGYVFKDGTSIKELELKFEVLKQKAISFFPLNISKVGPEVGVAGILETSINATSNPSITITFSEEDKTSEERIVAITNAILEGLKQTLSEKQISSIDSSSILVTFLTGGTAGFSQYRAVINADVITSTSQEYIITGVQDLNIILYHFG